MTADTFVRCGCSVADRCPWGRAGMEAQCLVTQEQRDYMRGTFGTHPALCTLPDPTPDHALADWIYEAF